MSSKLDGHDKNGDLETIRRSAAATVRMLLWLRDEVQTVQKDTASADLLGDTIDSIYDASGIARIDV